MEKKSRLEEQFKIIRVLIELKKGYTEGNFGKVERYLTDNSVFESQWVWLPLTGTKEIMNYLQGKGNALKEYNAFPTAELVDLFGGVGLLLQQAGNPGVMVTVQLDEEYRVNRIDLAAEDCYSYRAMDTWVEALPERLVSPEQGGLIDLNEHKIIISEPYYAMLDFYYEYYMGAGFNYCGENHLGIIEWKELLSMWRKLYKTEAVAELFNSFKAATGITSEPGLTKLKNDVVRLLKGRNQAEEYMLSGLEEWTNILCERYKDLEWIALL